jgi:kumamolisin
MKMKHFGIRAGIAMGALALGLSPILGVGAGADGTTAVTMSAVGQGVNVSALPGAQAFDPTMPNVPETVSFILDERNVSQLEQSVDQGINPSAFLSVSQFAQEYGQSQFNIFQLESYLGRFGISTQVYPGNVDVVANGTAGEFNKALSNVQYQYTVPGYPGTHGWPSSPAQTVHAPSTAPQLPSSIASYVLSILGLSNYAAFTSQAVHTPSALSTPKSGNSNSCVALSGLPSACNLPANFESNYGLSSLESPSAGRGETLAIVTLAAVDPTGPQYFWSNIMHLPNIGRSLTVVDVDNSASPPSDASGTGETDLDVEQSGGIAPGANVIVYQSGESDSNFIDDFFDAASQNIASSVSTSWGESEIVVKQEVAEGLETTTYEAAFNEAFLEMDAQGQSVFVAAGDAGAYDDNDELGSTELSVDTPANSPYVTTSGGTTLPWSGTVTDTATGISAQASNAQQRAWGWDYLWPTFATIQQQTLTAAAEGAVAGGGGGFSNDQATPSYQYGVSGTQSYTGVQYLTPTTPMDIGGGVIEPTAWNFNPKPTLVHGQGSGRALPDVSADADPFTGYLLYEPSFATIPAADGGPQPVLQGGWGGTSFVGPQFNGSTAVIDSSLGHRVGFWNPSIYSFATSRNSPFTALQTASTSNDNDFYTGNPGAVFNESTGLGIPNLSALARDFANS